MCSIKISQSLGKHSGASCAKTVLDWPWQLFSSRDCDSCLAHEIYSQLQTTDKQIHTGYCTNSVYTIEQSRNKNAPVNVMKFVLEGNWLNGQFNLYMVHWNWFTCLLFVESWCYRASVKHNSWYVISLFQSRLPTLFVCMIASKFWIKKDEVISGEPDV